MFQQRKHGILIQFITLMGISCSHPAKPQDISPVRKHKLIKLLFCHV